jgi:hypothetical protein
MSSVYLSQCLLNPSCSKFSDYLGPIELEVTFDIWDYRPTVLDRKYRVSFTKCVTIVE